VDRPGDALASRMAIQWNLRNQRKLGKLKINDRNFRTSSMKGNGSTKEAIEMSHEAQFRSKLQNSSGHKALLALNLERDPYDKFSGLIEYYDALLNREGLIERESEFRTSKLGLVLALIEATDIQGDVKMELISAIIDAWRLNIPERSQRLREDELYAALGCIEDIRRALERSRRHIDRATEWRLYAIALSCLPMAPTDFLLGDMSRINYLISIAIESPYNWSTARSLKDMDTITTEITAEGLDSD
jgi:hypothetical protein